MTVLRTIALAGLATVVMGWAAACSDDDSTASPCDGVICSGHGHCVDDSGEAVCYCDAGYAGTDCELCADGYHREASLCVPDATVDPLFGTPSVDGTITEEEDLSD